MSGGSQSLPQVPDPAWTPARLAEVAASFESAPLEEILQWSIDEFGDGLCLATSFGPQSIVLMHALSRLNSKAEIFYLDTGLLFPETYALRDQLAQRFGARFTRVIPELSIEQQARRYGDRLWLRQPDDCCELRKVFPLQRFLRDKPAWISGVRSRHNELRAATPILHWDEVNQAVKLNPLVGWSSEEIWAYLDRYELPRNPLHGQGYPSLGCQPCTRAVRPGEHPRAGRWPGFQKTECGIHRAPLINLPTRAKDVG